jgi:peptidoglycan hydrolase-like amidase
MRKKILLFISVFATIFIISQYSATGTEATTSIIQNPEYNTWISTPQPFYALAIEFLEEQTQAKVYLPDSDIPVSLSLDPSDNTKKFSILAFNKESKTLKIEGSGAINIHLYHKQKSYPLLWSSSQNIGKAKIISRKEWGADESIRYDYRTQEEINEANNLSTKQVRCQKLISKFPEEYTYKRVIYSEQGNNLLWPRQYSKTINKIVVHHTAESDKSKTIPGADKIRSIYYYHAKTRGWGDIGYNFIIDQNGNIYEGRSGGEYVVGGHAYCSNINTLGIALMGNFDRTQSGTKQIAALTQLLSGLSQKYKLNLSAENMFHGEQGPTLIGHKDVKSTACPGSNLYKLLPVFRKHFSVANIDFSISKPQTLEPLSSFGAKISKNTKVITMPPMSSKTITLSYKNTGKTTWRKGTWLYVKKNDNNNLWADSIIIGKNYVASDLKENEVRSGQTGNFDITINTGLESGIQTIELVPIINSERKLDSATLLLGVDIAQSELSYEIVKSEHPQNPLYYGQHSEAKIWLKNTGNTPWSNSGKFAITLGTKNNTPSSFANEKTPTTLAWMEQSTLQPGQIGSFVFDISSGFKQGNIKLEFVPRLGASYFLQDIGMHFMLQVKKPNYKAQILYNKQNLSFKPLETKIIQLGLRNLSDVHWQENQISIKVTKSDNITFQQNNFYFPEFIPKNESGYINIALTAPAEAGTYNTKFQILANDKKFNQTRWVFLPIEVVDPKNTTEITYLSNKELPLNFKEISNKIILRVKNTGNIRWSQKQKNRIVLMANSESSKLQSKDWKSPTIASELEDLFVAPGGVGTFRFTIQKNSTNNIKESFYLHLPSFGKVEGSDFYLIVKDNKNISSTTQKPELLANNNNNSSSLSFREKLKQRKKAYYAELEKFKNIIQERRNSFSNPTPIIKTSNKTIQTNTPIKNSNNNNNNNNIRVLLSFPHSSANVLSNNSADVYIDNKFFRTLEKNDSLWTRKDGNQMIVSVNGEKEYGKIIQVISKDFSSLFNWNRSPAWNKSLNDNSFAGTLEFRVINGKMHVINDIDLEDYLQGMAEVPDAEPLEKHKAMAVLARSYALHYIKTPYKKFPGQPYDGSDSPDVFQKYLGYNYSLRSNKWKQAIQDTKNEVLMHNDEILRTAYFSCSYGRTKTPKDAGWLNNYYQKIVKDVYISVNDIFGKDEVRYKKGQCGHGVGLSGQGASYLAKKGKSYEEILHYYYQNVEIEKVK